MQESLPIRRTKCNKNVPDKCFNANIAAVQILSLTSSLELRIDIS